MSFNLKLVGNALKLFFPRTIIMFICQKSKITILIGKIAENEVIKKSGYRTINNLRTFNPTKIFYKERVGTNLHVKDCYIGSQIFTPISYSIIFIYTAAHIYFSGLLICILENYFMQSF